MRANEREVERVSEVRNEPCRGACPGGTATYTKVVTEFDADYYGTGSITYRNTRYYRDSQLLNMTQGPAPAKG